MASFARQQKTKPLQSGQLLIDSLAEIPKLGKQIARLSVQIEELVDKLPDPDKELQLQPAIEKKLRRLEKAPQAALLTSAQMRKRIER